MIRRIAAISLVLCAGTAATLAQQLPPAPAPAENPITEEKRVLGKILFWDEQLSSNDTISCGSCHAPGFGGADGRLGFNPGPDGILTTPDDILGSPGVARADQDGKPVEDATFGFEIQVTGRSANAAIGAAYAPEMFWDGRAGSLFENPEDGTLSIPAGGALENQAIGPILSDTEMAHEGRTWSDVTSKIASVAPLGHATDLPADVLAALAATPTYPELFEAAFNTPEITAERIAFAIATYERTLVADETPPAGTGYFYLKTVIDSQGQELGLGATSSGQIRQVILTCASIDQAAGGAADRRRGSRSLPTEISEP